VSDKPHQYHFLIRIPYESGPRFQKYFQKIWNEFGGSKAENFGHADISLLKLADMKFDDRTKLVSDFVLRLQQNSKHVLTNMHF
jgi:hypothetical protein